MRIMTEQKQRTCSAVSSLVFGPWGDLGLSKQHMAVLIGDRWTRVLSDPCDVVRALEPGEGLPATNGVGHAHAVHAPRSDLALS